MTIVTYNNFMDNQYKKFLHEILGVGNIAISNIEKEFPQYPLLKVYKGNIVLTQSEKAGKLFVILQGKAAVLNTIHWSVNNLVDIIERPHIIGLSEVMSNQPTITSYVIAATDMVLFPINGNEFLKIIKNDPILCFDSLKIMCVLAENAMLSAEIKKTFPAKDVLGFSLYNFGKRNINIAFDVPREKMAEELNINLRTLYRYLDEFKKNGYIKNTERKIIIGPKELAKLSERYGNIQL